MSHFSTPVPVPAASLGGLIGAAVQVYRRALGLFVLLQLLPTLAAVAASLPLIAVGVWAASRAEAPGAAIVVAAVAFLLLILVVVLYQWRCLGMTSVAAVDIVEGRPVPTLGQLHARTRGLMGRVLVLLFLAFAAVLVVSGLTALVVAAMVAPIMRATGESNAAILGFAGLALLIWLALAVVSLVLATRWLYFAPVVAIEERSGWQSLGRSWALTRGEFWRTLGYYLLVSIAVGVPLTIVQTIGQAALAPALMAGREPNPVVIAIFGLVTLVVSVLVSPFLPIFVALMYADRRRRLAGSDAAAPGVQPGQVAGLPPAGYPPYGQPSAPGVPQAQPGASGQPPQAPPSPAPWQPPTGGATGPADGQQPGDPQR